MKKTLSIFLAIILLLSMALPVSAVETLEGAADLDTMKQVLLVMLMLLAVLVLCVLFFTCSLIGNLGKKKKQPGRALMGVGLYLTTIVVAGVFLFCLNQYKLAIASNLTVPTIPTQATTEPTTVPTEPTTEPTTAPTETTVPPTTEDPRLNFEAVRTEAGDPKNWGVSWEIMANGKIVDSYTREEPISFGDGSEYTTLAGFTTFRGNNYRNTSTYGTATVTEKQLTKVWSKPIGAYNGWSGSGWTGQPLVVQWDEETKQIMNLYAEKKAKEGLVEIIYATLDGYIYFYDLEDGSRTRDPIFMGANFKGAGSLDPRGYPLLYVGSGIFVNGKGPRMYVVSLITGKILYQNGNGDPFALRSWSAFDSSPLVDAETDTLIWPGENGVLYTIKLNTNYDKEAGTIEISPDKPVKTRYRDDYQRKNRYVGYEDSVVVVDHWLYVADNAGMFYCVDLNTMELVWAQDTKDDNNSSPVFEWDDEGNGYIYTAPSLHWTKNSSSKGTISVYKLNASTGEIVWEVPFDCSTVTDLSGGVQGTPLLGKEGTELEGLIIYPIARCPSNYKGKLVAISTETGEIVWETSTGNYAWSSPTAVYTPEGKAYIFQCDVDGDAKLYDAQGQRLTTISFGSTVEASPVVFNDMIIIGSRAGRVFGIKIS